MAASRCIHCNTTSGCWGDRRGPPVWPDAARPPFYNFKFPATIGGRFKLHPPAAASRQNKPFAREMSTYLCAYKCAGKIECRQVVNRKIFPFQKTKTAIIFIPFPDGDDNNNNNNNKTGAFPTKIVDYKIKRFRENRFSRGFSQNGFVVN